MRIAATIAHKPAASGVAQLPEISPSVKEACLTHAHTASPRPPRTNESKSKSKSKSISRSRGSDKPDELPLTSDMLFGVSRWN